MKDMLIFPIGTTAACGSCAAYLEKAGAALTDHPSPEVSHLLLDVPAFQDDGLLRSGEDISRMLRMLPPRVTVAGGNLTNPALHSHRKLDFLKDQGYLAENAAITAECAIQVAGEQLKTVFARCPVLVIGWGRIGKCMGQKLAALGSRVTIAARKGSDRAMVQALGYEAVDIPEILRDLKHQQVVFNTVPELLLHKEDTDPCRCLFVDLASKPGIEGSRVITARGLPGIYKPESAGQLIAETFLRLVREEAI